MQVNQLEDKKPGNHHEIPRKMAENEKTLVTKEMALSNLGQKHFHR